MGFVYYIALTAATYMVADALLSVIAKPKIVSVVDELSLLEEGAKSVSPHKVHYLKKRGWRPYRAEKQLRFYGGRNAPDVFNGLRWRDPSVGMAVYESDYVGLLLDEAFKLQRKRDEVMFPDEKYDDNGQQIFAKFEDKPLADAL